MVSTQQNREAQGISPAPYDGSTASLREHFKQTPVDDSPLNVPQPGGGGKPPLSGVNRPPMHTEKKNPKDALPVKPMRLKQMADPEKWAGGEGDLPGAKLVTARDLAAPNNAAGAASNEASPSPPVRQSFNGAGAKEKAQPAPIFKQHTRPLFDAPPSGWLRLDPPSRCTFYDWDDVFVRKFDIPDLAALFAAQEQADSTMFYDALQPCINVDIRDLSGPDLRGLMVWWKLNSYGQAPWRLYWTSKYGNRNQTDLFEGSKFDEVVLEMDRAEYADWKAKGFCIPTVRDSEFTERLKPEGADKFMYERAQYVLTDERSPDRWYPSRFERMREGGIPFLMELKKFQARCEHGIVNSIKVRDAHFQPEAAARYLRGEADRINELIELRGQRLTPAEFISYGEQVAELLEEALGIEEALDEVVRLESLEEDYSESVAAIRAGLQAREEVIPLRINVMDFFSEI